MSDSPSTLGDVYAAMMALKATGYCANCREPITTEVLWEGGSEDWTHDSNGLSACPDAPVATPAKYLVTALPPRNHACPLPATGSEGEVWRCPECTVPWQSYGRGWDVLDWVYVGPTQAVRDEPQA